MGTWDLVDGRANAADKKGLPNEKLGWIFFPEVKGGKGRANDLFASLNGWLVAKQAPKETIGHWERMATQSQHGLAHKSGAVVYDLSAIDYYI